MKTDRELLELAAKAAGLKIDKSSRNGGGSWNTGFDIEGDVVLDWHNGIKWNPLKCDGDALWLAVTLKIDIHQRVTEPRVAAIAAMQSPKIESVADENQRLAATRRAIVRAAAQIQLDKESK